MRVRSLHGGERRDDDALVLREQLSIAVYDELLRIRVVANCRTRHGLLHYAWHPREAHPPRSRAAESRLTADLIDQGEGWVAELVARCPRHGIRVASTTSRVPA